MLLAEPPIGLLAGASLFLDFDGTLVELAERPDAVSIGVGLGPLLQRLMVALDGRVALVSGRSVAQLDELLPGAVRMTVAGSHGAEIRNIGGTIAGPDRPAALAEASALFTERFTDRHGVVIEDKTLGVAIHYRLDPAVRNEVHALAEQFAQAHVLEIQTGKMLVELRVPGHDKGSAIATLLDRPPFAGHRPLFLGDDVTDETGFVIAAARKGAGILIGPARETAARYRLPDVSAVHAWLGAAAA